MSVAVGEIVEGKITDIMNYGVFVKLEDGNSGLVHISEISRDYVKDAHDIVTTGDVVKVKVLSVDDKGKIGLSIKKALPTPERKFINSRSESAENIETTKLDDMLSKFLKDSDEKQLSLKRNIDSKRGYSRKR